MWLASFWSNAYFAASYWPKFGAVLTFNPAWVAEDQVMSRVKREPIN